jgi:hypothetical protein
MKQVPRDATREVMGCFTMLILGALLTLGSLSLILPRLAAAPAGKPAPGLWCSALMWLVAPGLGIAAVYWLTYGFRRPSDPPRRR